MSVFNSVPPKINEIHLIKWLKENYSFFNKKSLTLKNLNSERDKNFLIKTSTIQKYVIKISNPEESRKLLNLQDYVLNNLNKRTFLKQYIPKKFTHL